MLVGNGVFQDFHAAGHVIDFDLDDMRAGAIGSLQRRVIGSVLEPNHLSDRQRHAWYALC
jgi:hypothetical protein